MQRAVRRRTRVRYRFCFSTLTPTRPEGRLNYHRRTFGNAIPFVEIHVKLLPLCNVIALTIVNSGRLVTQTHTHTCVYLLADSIQRCAWPSCRIIILFFRANANGVGASRNGGASRSRDYCRHRTDFVKLFVRVKSQCIQYTKCPIEIYKL